MSEIIIVSDALELRVVGEQHITPPHQLVLKNKIWSQQSLNWLRSVESENDMRKNVQGNMMLCQCGHAKMLLIFEQGEAIGVTSFDQIEPLNKAAYIGYWLDKEHQGKGILSQTLQVMTHHYTQRQETRRSMIKCRVDNIESNQVALRNDFRLKGCMQQAGFLNDDYHDTNLYTRIIDGSSE